MHAARLIDALQKLSEAISEVEQSVAALKSEHDPLASHIFISRPEYRRVNDTKSGKRREVAARLSYNAACELGFRGSLDQWERQRGGNTRSVKVVAGRRREARSRECVLSHRSGSMPK